MFRNYYYALHQKKYKKRFMLTIIKKNIKFQFFLVLLLLKKKHNLKNFIDSVNKKCNHLYLHTMKNFNFNI